MASRTEPSPDYSYAKQIQMLQMLRLVEIAIAGDRKQVKTRLGALEESADRLQRQAVLAIAADQAGLAREALARRTALITYVGDVERELAALQDDQLRLANAARRLSAKIEAFRTHKEVIKARHTAADAETHINHAFNGISEEIGDTGLTARRAQDKTARLLARAAAFDALLSCGALDDAALPVDDEFRALMDRACTTEAVDRELAGIEQGMADVLSGHGPISP